MEEQIVHVEPQSDRFVEDAWSIKETISQTQNMLDQKRPFFIQSYVKGDTYVSMDGETVVGFAVIRSGTYLSLLGVHPDWQGNGRGSALVKHVIDEHGDISCHVRASNQAAIRFYKQLGFTKQYEQEEYYEDGDTAYYMTYAPSSSSSSSLSDRIF